MIEEFISSGVYRIMSVCVKVKESEYLSAFSLILRRALTHELEEQLIDARTVKSRGHEIMCSDALARPCQKRASSWGTTE